MATADDIDETSDLKPSFHIVIIGAGLIGLATAILLRKAGYKVTVLEQDTELRPVRLHPPTCSIPYSTILKHWKQIGAGIQLPANSTRVLKELGILEKAVVKAIQPHAIILYSYETGSVLNTTSLDPYVQATYGVPHLVIHRADLRELLCDEAVARGADIRLGSKVELFEETNSGNVVIHVGKGGKLDANLVIGADGARSMCREALTQRPDRPKFMGKIAYRIVVHEEAMARNPRLGEFISPPNVHTWLGPGSFVVGYPLKGVFNIVATRPAPANEEIFFGARPVDVEVLKYLFRDWDIRMRDLLEIATEFQKWMVFEGEELESWVSPGEKFVLTGDAAHAPLPYLFVEHSPPQTLTYKLSEPKAQLWVSNQHQSSRIYWPAPIEQLRFPICCIFMLRFASREPVM